MTEEKPKKKKSGKHSREKGKRFEREICNRFKEIYSYGGDRIRRGDQSRMGHDGADVETPHFWVECKNHTKVNVKAALRQASYYRAKRNDRRYPVAVTKDLREPVLITMYFDDFSNLLEMLDPNGLRLVVPEDF